MTRGRPEASAERSFPRYVETGAEESPRGHARAAGARGLDRLDDAQPGRGVRRLVAGVRAPASRRSLAGLRCRCRRPIRTGRLAEPNALAPRDWDRFWSRRLGGHHAGDPLGRGDGAPRRAREASAARLTAQTYRRRRAPHPMSCSGGLETATATRSTPAFLAAGRRHGARSTGSSARNDGHQAGIRRRSPSLAVLFYVGDLGIARLVRRPRPYRHAHRLLRHERQQLPRRGSGVRRQTAARDRRDGRRRERPPRLAPLQRPGRARFVSGQLCDVCFHPWQLADTPSVIPPGRGEASLTRRRGASRDALPSLPGPLGQVAILERRLGNQRVDRTEETLKALELLFALDLEQVSRCPLARLLQRPETRVRRCR